ncbi:MAG TPA: hypothetical protein VK897_22150 [Anaerolineales bacterium]|nr:hypothetical protein [Anaerolineales bacterium]
MEEKNTLTKVLAIAGTVLVWFPILAPILLSILLFATQGRFLFDYLMPAELFLFALAGSGLLLWATLRAHSHVKFIAWGLGMAVFMLSGVLWFAEATGLASGEAEPTGWLWGIATTGLALYSLGLMIMGTGGALLLQDLFKKQRLSA